MAPINGNDNGDNKTVGAEKPTGTAMNGTRNTASNKSIASGHANAQSPPSRATGANATLPRKPRAKKAPPTEHTKATVFVRKLPKDTTDAELEAFFGEVGPLKSCFVVRKRGEREEAGDGGDGAAEEAMTSKDTLGYGFVRYALAEDAQQAIDTLSKKKFRGKRTLLLEIAKHRQRHADSKVTSASGVVDAEETSDQEATEMTTEDRPVVAPIAATGANAQAIATGPAKPMVFTKGHKDHLRTVLVRGLPTEVTKKQLYKKARKFGDVKEVVMPVSVGEDAAPIELAGHARVVYQHPMDADKAVKQLDKHVFKGKTVFACKAPNVQAAKKEARVLVRNVPFLCTESHLIEAFAPHGFLLEVTLPRKSQPNADGTFSAKGFAFITFASRAEAEAAMAALNATPLPTGKRVIAIDWALPKDQYKEFEKQEMAETADANSNPMDEDDAEKSGNDSDDSDDDGVDVVFDEDDEDEVEEEDAEAKPVAKKESDDVQNGTTIFIRNLAFETTEEDLREKFRPYGSLKYCKLTLDRETGRPRGTGFIHFWKKEDADKVLAEAELAAAMMTSRTVAEKKAAGGVVSQLVPETTSGFWLHGRQIFLMAAVDRSTAHKLDEEKSEKIASDGRNLHLLKEGYIRAGSQAALDLKPGELAKREGSFQDRKRKILKHPHLFISTTRLSVRNLAKGVDEKQLRDLATKCAKEWVAEVTAMEKENRLGRTERLELIRLKKEGNNIRGRVFVKQAKIVRDKTAVDLKAIAKQQPKTSLASADATAAAVAAVDKKKLIGVSKGYGFVEFTSHAHALGCLRRMNNNPDLLPGGRRLMVEFAIENKSILSKRESRGKPEAGDKDVEAPKAIDCKKDKKRKRDGEQQGDGAVAAGDIKKAKKGKKDGADEKKKPSAKGQPSRSDKKGPSSTAIVTSGKPVHTRTTTSTSSSPSSTAATPATKPKKQTQKRKPAKADAFDDLVNKYKQKLVGGSCTVDAAAPKKAAGRWFD